MKLISRYHSVALFVIYTIVLNFKQVSFIDGFVITFLAAYIGLSFFMEHNRQPDIKADMEARFLFVDKQLSQAIQSIASKNEADLRKFDNDIKEMKTKVSAIGGLKSVGMSQTNIKF